MLKTKECTRKKKKKEMPTTTSNNNDNVTPTVPMCSVHLH